MSRLFKSLILNGKLCHSFPLKTNNMTAFKTYRKTATVKAKLFEEGDEDGFMIRYYNDEDIDEDGCIHTSGLIGEHKIKIPYVSTLENKKHLSHGFGREYLCVGVKGERWLVDKDIFEATYEIVQESPDTFSPNTKNK